ncbi:uncharacterized protein LOC110806399 [Carica papaya]|uniref:uncharacterized protein LOC110806399 n=1 Tax=Carica papaya TaxID=3649 RepID=UPI000B8CE0B4|nr:uncharacterized protein LOC110806399 [Carica papaya]XP_021886929.1 uncharacterized protein LOC110806399 [Carica papaya]
MVKPKQQQQLAGRSAKKKKTRSSHVDSFKSKTIRGLRGEGDWVIVKKQRVTILVPPVPTAKNSIMPKPASSQLQAVPTEKPDSLPLFPVETCLRMPSVNERENCTLPAPTKGFQIAKKSPVERIPAMPNPPSLDFKMASENQDCFGTSKSQRILGVSNTSRTIKRPKLDGPSLVGGNMLPHQRLRASHLEKKLQRAGGLSQWLASLGLGHFESIFQRKSITKFQLLNLTMNKLREMGAFAVGPRRKLIHAIDCVCQPYCFEAS